MSGSYDGSCVAVLHKLNLFELHNALYIVESEHHVRPRVRLAVAYYRRYGYRFVFGCVVVSAFLVNERGYEARVLIKTDFQILVLH